MQLDTAYYERCISTLKKAHSLLLKADPENIDFDMYRSACIKEFEIILEQSGKLLKKVLKPYLHSAKAADELTFKNVFRNAVLRGLINDEACERWLIYRDNRNHTTHDYGVNFAEETLLLLPKFIEDATNLAETICNASNEYQNAP
jgi:nucleotidyltransferase substrate binding protein (TIGR01987 family)